MANNSSNYNKDQNIQHISKNNLISVIVCTYKRLDMLKIALESLVYQETDGKFLWDILVVDNDPDCSAKDLVNKLSKSCPVSMRYIVEKNIGLSHARNRGIEESTGGIIAFTDDDVAAAPRWLLEIFNTFSRTNADCVGGNTLVKWEGNPMESVKECERDLVSLDWGEKEYRVFGKKLPSGCNIAFNRRVFDEGFCFPIELGRIGSLLLAGEETELFLLLQKEGKSIWYSPKSIIHHRMTGDRLSEGYYIRRAYWDGLSWAIIDGRIKYRFYPIVKACLRTGKALLGDLPYWVITKLMRQRGKNLLVACKLTKCLGYWAGVLPKTFLSMKSH
jgi:glucosyl-dolichyl phosphate glucuronosyltransferase